MAKKRLVLSVEENKVKELKERARVAGMNLSEYLSRAGSVSYEQFIEEQLKSKKL